jgi:AcrR family transcriptional regulator
MPKDTFFNLNVEKQEKVMRSAINEFITNGFEKGNIGDIAKRAGVAKGSMYQYFENKKELFLFSVSWAVDYIVKKYDRYIFSRDENLNVFDFIYQGAKEIWLQLREERELVVFVQDVFLGKYNVMTDESVRLMMKASDEVRLRLIQDGKQRGFIRQDIDDNILSLFMAGVSLKFKEYLMNEARIAGEDLIDKDFEVYEDIMNAMIELLKTGMGAKKAT